jgi:hypothetical protein
MSGIISARARDHLHAPLRRLNHDLDDAALLVVAERHAFARRPARHEEVYAFRDLKLDESGERLLID